MLPHKVGMLLLAAGAGQPFGVQGVRNQTRILGLSLGLAQAGSCPIPALLLSLAGLGLVLAQVAG